MKRPVGLLTLMAIIAGCALVLAIPVARALRHEPCRLPAAPGDPGVSDALGGPRVGLFPDHVLAMRDDPDRPGRGDRT